MKSAFEVNRLSQIARITLIGLTLAFHAIAIPPETGVQNPRPYTAVQVYPFMAGSGIAFPADYQAALMEDIAREISLAFPAILIVRQGAPAPTAQRLLRIMGIVTRFKPGNRAKRYLIGMGAGATVVKANVIFADAGSGRTLLTREAQGTTWTGIGGGDSKSAADSLAKTIAKVCKSAHFLEPR